MKLVFRDADRRAIDILLDREFAGSAGQLVRFSPVDEKLHDRIVRVERVLSLLNEFPAADPSADLARRTLRRVEEASGQPLIAPRGVGSQPIV